MSRLRVIIGMECSGALRSRFRAAGHHCISVDLKPAEDDGAGHVQGDVFDLIGLGCWDLGIFHPDCTYLTSAAEWAYADPDFDRYPGVGYHQRVRPGTLTGAARRVARERAIMDAVRLWLAPIPRIVIENPVGVLSRHIGKPAQVVQPWWFGDDASKATCLWTRGGVPLLHKTRPVAPRMVNGRPRWANQTDGGQNRLSPGEGRAADRARTYPGFADAAVDAWACTPPDLRAAA